MRSTILCLGLAVVSCVADTGVTDDENASFAEGKGDTGRVAEGSPEARGILKLVNEATLAKLKTGVGLSDRVAENIIAYRDGDDGDAGTADDELFDTLASLDSVPFVGPNVFDALLAYARAHGYIAAAPQTCTEELALAWTACANTGDAIECWGRRPQTFDSPRLQNLSVGEDHACGIDAQGAVWCWGSAHQGRLGSPLIQFEGNIAVNVPEGPVKAGGLRSIRHVSAGMWHTCAVDADGGAWCWGDNSDGQLGAYIGSGQEYCNGTCRWIPPFSPTPVDVALDDVVDVAAASFRTCFQTRNGDVYCTGRDNTFEGAPAPDAHAPTKLPGLAGVRQLVSGGQRFSAHFCALKNDKTVACWGQNQWGQLGNDDVLADTHLSTGPVAVVGLTGVEQIAAGGGHVCARVTDGSVWCWGANSVGQLGDGTTTNRSMPVKVSGISLTTDLVAGGGSTCARKDDGTWWCWGNNNDQLLNDGGTSPTRTTPHQMQSLCQ